MNTWLSLPERGNNFFRHPFLAQAPWVHFIFFFLGIPLHHSIECLALTNTSQEAANLWHAHVGNPPEALGFLKTLKMCMFLTLANTLSLMVMLPLTQLPHKGHRASSHIVVQKYLNENWDAHGMLGLITRLPLPPLTVRLVLVSEW